MAGGDDMRFSDTELRSLSEKFDAHVKRFDTHVSRFDKHEKLEEAWREDQMHREEQHTLAQIRNAEAIEALTRVVESQVEATKPIVQMHTDLMGAARVGHKVTDGLIWLAKAGGFLAMLGAAIHWIIEHAPKP